MLNVRKNDPQPEGHAKILFFDIECTNLKPDFGTVLCIGWKWLGEKKVSVPAITDYKGWKKEPWNDKRLIQDFAKVMEEADVWVTYNGKRFDVPYIQAKLLIHGLTVLPNTPHVDLYQVVRHAIVLSRKSLANVAKNLKLKAEKTPVEGDHWLRAMCGNEKSIKYVVDHCIADVLLLEEAYHRLKPLVRQHPIVVRGNTCRSCGSKKVQKRGQYRTTKKLKQRTRCMDCGAWAVIDL